jgi:hypothetical protein
MPTQNLPIVVSALIDHESVQVIHVAAAADFAFFSSALKLVFTLPSTEWMVMLLSTAAAAAAADRHCDADARTQATLPA